jgi:Kef-type K+ transport system membrane component KefB
MKKFQLFALVLVSVFALLFVSATPSFASADASGGSETAQHFGSVFAMFALILLAGKLGSIVERFGQPAVIGELGAGIVLAGLGYFGWNFIDQTLDNSIITFIASFGALILLFSIGLESDITEMKSVGLNAFAVAIIGVVFQFLLGAYLLGPLFFPNEDANSHIFFGAALVATSVGITAAVFRSLGISRTRSARTVLGAAVLDDIFGLVVLAIVSSLVTGGSVTAGSVALIFVKSFGFLAAAVYLGSAFATQISSFLRLINTGKGMKIALALGFALTFGYFAELVGLDPIIGAFAAGLLLDKAHFKDFDDPEIVTQLHGVEYQSAADQEKVNSVIDHHRDTHVEVIINTLGLTFIPVFFVYTGMQVDFGSLLQPKLYAIAGVVVACTVVAKIISGWAAKGSRTEKLLVGIAMVPRGEVALIFAATGRSLGVLNEEMFSVIALVVIMTTLIVPPIIKVVANLLKKDEVVLAN